MKCPVCEKDDKPSETTEGFTSVTLSGFGTQYQDDSGICHDHDENRMTVSFSCSEGHFWEVYSKPPCSSPDCDWGNHKTTKIVKKLKYQPIRKEIR